MLFLIVNCHSANRGDEAAVHAMIDELEIAFPGSEFVLGMRGETRYPNMPSNVKMIDQLIPSDNLQYRLALLSKGRMVIGKTYSEFEKYIKMADIVLHAPGGPSIGDTYIEDEMGYLRFYNLLVNQEIPYMFYAPSMGPFNEKNREKIRKRVLEGAKKIVVRDPISKDYVSSFVPKCEVELTLDSALQHDLNKNVNNAKLKTYARLDDFINTHKKCIGVTITDLKWHPVLSKTNVAKNISDTFIRFLTEIEKDGYGIVFIPQLYGTGNDKNLMGEFCFNKENYFVIDDSEGYDTYFQQYVISKLYAVIGMRYHSNIFSAKAGTPFISISYEQKMAGFMNKMNLEKYCINVKELSFEKLSEKFELLNENYGLYKNFLINEHDTMKNESHRTTEYVVNYLLGR